MIFVVFFLHSEDAKFFFSFFCSKDANKPRPFLSLFSDPFSFFSSSLHRLKFFLDSEATEKSCPSPFVRGPSFSSFSYYYLYYYLYIVTH